MSYYAILMQIIIFILMSKIAPDRCKFPNFNWNTKDRPRKWQDIFLNSSEHEEILYQSDTELFDQAEKKRQEEIEKQNTKKNKTNQKIKNRRQNTFCFLIIILKNIYFFIYNPNTISTTLLLLQ